MRTLRKTGVTALTAGIALALGFTPAVIVAGGAMSGDGDTMTLAPAASPAGTLTLSTTSEKGIVTWNGQRQEFAESKQCEIAVSGDSANLLDISGSVGEDPGTAGFRGGSIGVFEFTDGSGPSNASQCFRVDADSTTPSEDLTLALGGDVQDDPFNVIAVSGTVTAIAQSRGGTLGVTLLGPDGDVPLDDVVWRNTKSGNRITIPPVSGTFTGVQLKAKSGSFSVTGATFDLESDADTFLACGGTYFDEEAGFGVEYAGSIDETCDGFAVRLGTDGAKKTFTKPLTEGTLGAQLIFTIPWDTVDAIDANTLPAAKIDFEIGTGYRDMGFCPDYLFDSSGDLAALAPSDPNIADLRTRDWELDVASIPGSIGIQFACIGDRSAHASKSVGNPGFDLDITDTIYVIGDARMRL